MVIEHKKIPEFLLSRFFDLYTIHLSTSEDFSAFLFLFFL